MFVRPEARRTAIGDGTVLALGATPGEAYQALDGAEAWAFHNESMRAYSEQRYADALEAVRTGLQHTPDHPGLHYNYACFATLAGDTGDETFGHLRRSVELLPRFREQAHRDDDFAAVRDDPRLLFAERAGLGLRRVPSARSGATRSQSGGGKTDATRVTARETARTAGDGDAVAPSHQGSGRSRRRPPNGRRTRAHGHGHGCTSEPSSIRRGRTPGVSVSRPRPIRAAGGSSRRFR